MNQLCLLGGLGAGAGLMYIFDPVQGRRRRALLRDQGVRLANRACAAGETVGRDLCNRAAGFFAEAKAMLLGGEPAGDDRLVQRVRSALGRLVSHPRAIEVSARDGRITLRGPVLAREVDRLLSGVRDVAGVQDVDSLMRVHEEPGTIPELQGGSTRSGPVCELLQRRWSPATRFLAATTGGGLVAWGLTQRAPLACILGTLGLALAARGLTNRGVQDLMQTANNLNKPAQAPAEARPDMTAGYV